MGKLLEIGVDASLIDWGQDRLVTPSQWHRSRVEGKHYILDAEVAWGKGGQQPPTLFGKGLIP